MPKAHIGIGSNLGDRQGNCQKALDLLRREKQSVLKRSRMYETEPWGVEDQPRFINMVVEIRTGLQPEDLLRLLKKIEEDMGREHTGRWGPRVIDLDILLYDDLIIAQKELQIPHARMHERAFVLEPMAEISPLKMHPILLKSIDELLSIVKQ